MNSIKLLQWNCRSITNKKIELLQLIQKENIDIVILSETWLNPQRKFKIHPYKIIRLDRQLHEGGGVAMIIKNNINIKAVKSISSYDENFQAIQITIDNLNIWSI